MNILHVTPYYAPAYAFGGVARAVEGMAKAVLARGHNVTVLTTDAFSQNERYQHHEDEVMEGVRVIRLQNRSVRLRGKANLSTPRGLKEAARKWLDWADITHLHEFRTMENLTIAPLAAASRHPLMLSPHGTLTQSTGRSLLKQSWDRLFSRRIASAMNAVICLTEAEKADTAALWKQLGVQEPGLFVIPNGVDVAAFEGLEGDLAFRQRHGLADSMICLFLGRLHPRKGVIELAQAFKWANVRGAKLVFAGADDGALSALRPMLSDRIIYAGYLEGADRLAALAAADIFALPATGEGLPLAALEAMAAGLPLLLSPGCNLPDAEEAGAALIVEPQVDQIARALSQLLSDSAFRHEMGRRAHTLAIQRFNWDEIGAELEGVYRRYL
ncbi:MAG: glycosyltransferase [Anaerolineae bacterium]|nr:glycosyltransferase [Anaerolineae bacterium]